jgi:hypothetical protein
MPDIPTDRTASAVALPAYNGSRLRDSAMRGRIPAAMLAVALSLALLLVIWWPFLSTATFNAGQADWRYRANYMSYTVKSLFTYGQIPFWATAPHYHQLWSPDAHGFFSNPETEVISPYVPLYAVLDFGTAVRVSLLLHLVIGVAGLYALLAFLGARHWSIVALCAVLVYGSGFFVRHVLVGHLQFVSYTYFPAALWLYLRALHSSRLTRAAWASLFASGLAVALAYYEGNIHLVIQFLFVLALVAAFTALLSPGARVHAFTTAAGLIVSFFLLAAFKLLPGIAEYGGYRPNDMNTYRSVRQFVDNVLYCLPSPPWPVPHELGFYLGIPGAVIVTIGLLNIRKSTLPLVATAFLFLILLFAPFGQLLVYVPLLGTQRPTRLRSEVILLAAVLGAQALSRMRDHLSRSLPRRPHRLHGSGARRGGARRARRGDRPADDPQHDQAGRAQAARWTDHRASRRGDLSARRDARCRRDGHDQHDRRRPERVFDRVSRNRV